MLLLAFNHEGYGLRHMGVCNANTRDTHPQVVQREGRLDEHRGALGLASIMLLKQLHTGLALVASPALDHPQLGVVHCGQHGLLAHSAGLTEGSLLVTRATLLHCHILVVARNVLRIPVLVLAVQVTEFGFLSC